MSIDLDLVFFKSALSSSLVNNLERILMLSNICSFFSYYNEPKAQFPNYQDLDDLFRNLTSSQENLDQWLKWSDEIKNYVKEHGHDLNQLNVFLCKLTEWGMNINPQKTLNVIENIFTLEMLENVIRYKISQNENPYTNFSTWLAEQKSPHFTNNSVKNHLYLEWRKYRSIVLHFIPNLINIFLGAFNFLDANKKYTTLWEKHLLLEIVYKFFVIPFCLIKFLQPVLKVTTKVYLVSALVIASVGILLSCYQRWLRTLDAVVNCHNLDRKMEKGEIDPKVGQVEELHQLTTALEVGKSVILLGNSGDGKTALLHHFIQKKHAGELSENLQKLSVFEVDCGLVVSSFNYGYSEVINQIKEQIEGYDNQVIFFFDELYDILSNKEAARAFKKRFLEDKPHARIVATMTFEEFAEIEKQDKDESLKRRLSLIPMNCCQDDDEDILLDILRRTAPDVPFTDEAIKTITELAKSNEYLPKIGRPARAKKILEDAIALCRTAYNPKYVSVELSKEQQIYKKLKLQAYDQIKLNPENLKRMREIKSKIKILKKDLKKQKQQVVKIIKIREHQQKMHLNYHQKIRCLTETFKKFSFKNLQVNEKMQISSLWYYFYAIDAMNKKLQINIDKVRKHLPIQIDKKMISQVYENAKSVETILHKNTAKENKISEK